MLIHKVQGHHGAVIQVLIPLAQDAGGEVLRPGKGTEGLHQLRIVLLAEGNLRRPEVAEVPGSMIPGGNMEIIGIEHTVGAGYDNGFRFDFRDLRGNSFIGLNGFQDLVFTSSAHLGNDHRGMGNHICGSDGHRDASFSVFCFVSTYGSF